MGRSRKLPASAPTAQGGRRTRERPAPNRIAASRIFLRRGRTAPPAGAQAGTTPPHRRASAIAVYLAVIFRLTRVFSALNFGLVLTETRFASDASKAKGRVKPLGFRYVWRCYRAALRECW